MSIATIGSYLAKHKQSIKDIFEAAPHYRANYSANVLGLQVLRTVLAQARHAVRPRHDHLDFAAEEKALDRDGCVAIENFLSPEDFTRVKTAYEEFGKSDKIKVELDRGGTGVDWYTGRIDFGLETTEAERLLTQKIASNPKVRAFAEHILRRRLPHPPTLSYQRLVVRPGFVDEKDRECLLHSDRHYSCVKMALYMSPTSRAEGAYVWCPGSHKVTPARLRHEYEYSLRQSRLKNTPTAFATSDLVALGRNKVAPERYQRMGLRETSIEAPENTLVVSNNLGFHRRGEITAGHERHQIRILFYYAQATMLGRTLRAAAKLIGLRKF